MLTPKSVSRPQISTSTSPGTPYACSTRPSTEPYCLSMLAPRVSRGGTMRPENSSNVWLNTFCDWSRASTLLSSVTPDKPVWMAEAEIPLAAASFLKSSSQVSNGPVPQGAANADATDVNNRAPKVRARRERREIIGPLAPEFDTSMVSVHVMSNVRSKIGQNKADVVTFDAFPSMTLNSSLGAGEQRHRRSVDRRCDLRDSSQA